MLPPRYSVVDNAALPGGFGAVVRVHDSFLDRRVMFKFMQDARNNQQLVNEVRGLSGARSKHVVEIYDVVLDARGYLVGIVIEELTGAEYTNFHVHAAQNPTTYLGLLRQIATALRDLHAAGIVHRDLKLENMRDSASGVLKIFDFGLASVNSNYLTQQNRGTLVYAAPELYAQGARISSEMDVYAFGVCAWALASARFAPQLLERPPQQSARAPSIATVMANLDPEVAWAIDASLAPDPAQRPTAAQLAWILSRHALRGQHRGRFVQNSHQVFELSSQNPFVRIRIANKGTLEVTYTGVSFQITGTNGDVFINNYPSQLHGELPDACVLTFGHPQLQADRTYVTFAASHPEII